MHWAIFTFRVSSTESLGREIRKKTGVYITTVLLKNGPSKLCEDPTSGDFALSGPIVAMASHSVVML